MNLPRVFTPKRHVDERGWLSETFHEARLRELGSTHRFVQENRSYSKRKGTLRGLHFQAPPQEQAKLISVLQGRIFDVAVDIRRGSPTFGKYVAAELSAEHGQQLYIPAGFAHGFLTLDDGVTVQYNTSNYYAPEFEGGICWDDPDIAIRWPLGLPILSDKDRHLPRLRTLASPFAYNGDPLGTLETQASNTSPAVTAKDSE